MNKALILMFWGYLFVFFRLQIVVDVLAAPIGYYLIYSGARLMAQQFPFAKKVEVVAFIGMLISVPGVFVNLSEVTSGGWMIYAEVLFVWKVIVVYYLFGTWLSAFQGVGFARVRDRVRLVYVLYMVIHFTMMLLSALLLNVGGDDWTVLFVVVSVMVVLMDIVLMVLIAGLGRVDFLRRRLS